MKGRIYSVRLIVTIIWIIAAVCWLPWFLLVLRLVTDVAMGTPLTYSRFLVPTLQGLWPGINWSWWPPARWLDWQIVSMWPVAAFLGVCLSAGGWRVYWLEQDGILTRPGWLVALSIIAPPLAPFIMYGDSRRRHLAKESYLEAEVQDAKARLEGENS